MGINYGESKKNLIIKNILNKIKKFVKKNKIKIIFEPGRSITGDTGYLLAK